MLGQNWQNAKDIQQISRNIKWNKHKCLQVDLVWKNTQHFCKNNKSWWGALGAYDDGNQVAPKGARILNLVDIDKDVAEEILKSLQDQQNFDGSIPKVSKDHDIPLIVACKKVGVDGKPNKKHKRSSINGYFTLAFAFSQFAESSKKIETMKMEIQSQMAKEAMEMQNPLSKWPWRWKNTKLKIFYKLNFRWYNFLRMC